MKLIFNIIQISIAIIVILLVLVQQKGAGLGNVFGGEGNIYTARRGAERIIFIGTIIFSSLFLIIAVVNAVYIQ